MRLDMKLVRGLLASRADTRKSRTAGVYPAAAGLINMVIVAF